MRDASSCLNGPGSAGSKLDAGSGRERDRPAGTHFNLARSCHVLGHPVAITVVRKPPYRLVRRMPPDLCDYPVQVGFLRPIHVMRMQDGVPVEKDAFSFNTE